MGALLVCQRGLRPSPSPSVFISISVGPPRIPPHKSQTEKPQVGDGGGGGGGQGSRKLFSTDKGSPKIPHCDKQSERASAMEAQSSAGEFVLSLVGLS